jgi:hypothetical protein
MPIELNSEQIISVREVAGLKFMRGRRKKLSNATLWRWITCGLRGVKLETILIGGTRCTSVEAVERFIMATQSEAKTRHGRTPSQRAKALAKCTAKLEAIGL